MKKFNDWVKIKEAASVMGGGESPAVTAVKSQANVAVTNAVKTGADPVKAAKDVAAKAMQSGKLPLKDLAKVMPSDEDANPTTKMMKKK